MHIVVVEPHSDDAFLSLGWHLEKVWRDHDRTILTVYADSRRAREAAQYAEAIGAVSVVLGLEGSRMNSTPGRSAIVPQIRHVLDLLPWDIVVFPLGLQHPDHLRVAASRIPGSLRYIDTPYQTKQKLAGELAAKTEGARVYSLVYPGKRKWRHIPVFKTQAKFFHFNPMVGTHVSETVLCLG